MSTSFLRRLGRMFLVLLVQLILLNNIHLFGYVSPVIIAFVTMNFRRGSSRMGLLLWGFITGFLYDLFSNTMGMGMFTATLLAMLQPFLLSLFTPRDAAEDMLPSMYEMGMHRYLLYTFFSMLLFHVVYYLLDAFMLSNLWLTLVAIGTGTLFSFFILALFQSMTRRVE